MLDTQPPHSTSVFTGVLLLIWRCIAAELASGTTDSPFCDPDSSHDSSSANTRFSAHESARDTAGIRVVQGDVSRSCEPPNAAACGLDQHKTPKRATRFERATFSLEGGSPPQTSGESTQLTEGGIASAAPTTATDAHLEALLAAWPQLSEEMRAAVRAMVEAAV